MKIVHTVNLVTQCKCLKFEILSFAISVFFLRKFMG